MILNLKKDIHLRAVIFENIAKVLIRRRLKNNFIFLTRYFDSFDEISSKYRLDLSFLDKKIVSFLNKNINSIDLISFSLNNNKDRLIEGLSFYEIKTKNFSNKAKFDICVSSFKAYKFLKENNFPIFLASFVLFEDWKYSFNTHTLDLDKLRVYSRFKP